MSSTYGVPAFYQGTPNFSWPNQSVLSLERQNFWWLQVNLLVSLSDSALRDADYIPINTVLPVTDYGYLDISMNRVNITVVDDLDVEGNETFSVVLELINPPANVLMGIMNTTIVIIDNGIIIVAATIKYKGSFTSFRPL